jgi:hypothetical protein
MTPRRNRVTPPAQPDPTTAAGPILDESGVFLPSGKRTVANLSERLATVREYNL